MGRRNGSANRTLEMPDPAVFDIAQLRRYTVGQNDLEMELIGLFKLQLPQFLKQIGTAASEFDWKIATHSLKGSSLTMGAPVIANLAERLENLGIEGGPEERKALIGQLSAAIADFNQAVDSFYP